MAAAYKVQKVPKWNLKKLNQVCNLLYLAGRDMASRYGLNHWNNSYFKDMIVVGLCALKNDLYIVYDGETPIATFQLNRREKEICFQKLATDPSLMGKGIGSFCMTAIEEMAAQEGKQAVVCEVYDKSEHARSFYEHRGYAVTGKTDTLKYSEYQMRKEL